ncbi:GNAT family N-acetyltransferase [Dysgonomonas sp. ZJ279]|uniref:GNAT family N-acetyltransferase n=1 Tax=Dysgonomonas sp. ZJ279 TaxID=2709796 RepID=UPI0013EBD1FB|nr:GNAT family N-acetyltransferase [Dysgonomonas sp. ZJ279]
MLLENSQIRLRALEPEDLELLYQWENNSELWIYGSTVSPYSKLALRQYINDSLEMDIYQSKQLRLMIDIVGENTTIGTVDLYDINMRNKNAGIGILIDEAYRNRKYASQALELMREYAFNFLKLHQLYAYIGVNNKPSLKLFENIGYSPVGILKDWIQLMDDNYEDVLVTQLINGQINE